MTTDFFLFLIPQFLGQQISEDLLPDLSQIFEHSDPVELGRLLQLILGCAVNCEKKQGTTYPMVKCFPRSRQFPVADVCIIVTRRLQRKNCEIVRTDESNLKACSPFFVMHCRRCINTFEIGIMYFKNVKVSASEYLYMLWRTHRMVSKLDYAMLSNEQLPLKTTQKLHICFQASLVSIMQLFYYRSCTSLQSYSDPNSRC